VLVIPLSFVSDHIETLYEVDLLFADVAQKAGVRWYRRTPALNDSPLFISALAGLVRDHLADAPAHTCSACRARDGAAALTLAPI
jgi:ferrochelatase